MVTEWLGNTPQIALKYYLRVTDEDFAQACGEGAAKSAAKALQNPVQQAHASTGTHSQEMTKAPAATRAYAKSCDS